MNILTLRIKKHWFDKILNGEKTVEYRDFKPFYQSRIENKNITHVKLIAGYSKNSPEKVICVEKILILDLQYCIYLKLNKNG